MVKKIYLALLCWSVFCFAVHSSTQESACTNNRQIVSFNDGKIPIEPSGLIYVQKYDIFIGVSDNYDVLEKLNAPEFSIFWFKDDGNGKLLAYPLLNQSQASKFKLYDLESITMDSNHQFYTFSSLALHTAKRERDTINRFQAFKFKIHEVGKGQFEIKEMDWLSSQLHGYWRDWLIALNKAPWTIEQIVARPEVEDGINLEALTVSPDNNLILGFRGPLFFNKNRTVWDALAMEIKVPAKENEFPKYVNSFYLPNLSNKQFGFRAMTPVLGKPWWYVVVLGPTGQDIKQFEVLLWNAKTGQIQSRVVQPEAHNIVWEGAAVKSIIFMNGKKYVHTALVDDFNGCFKYIDLPFPLQ